MAVCPNLQVFVYQNVFSCSNQKLACCRLKCPGSLFPTICAAAIEYGTRWASEWPAGARARLVPPQRLHATCVMVNISQLWGPDLFAGATLHQTQPSRVNVLICSPAAGQQLHQHAGRQLPPGLGKPTEPALPATAASARQGSCAAQPVCACSCTASAAGAACGDREFCRCARQLSGPCSQGSPRR